MSTLISIFLLNTPFRLAYYNSNLSARAPMMKIASIFFGLLFLLFSYFQFNDPDPHIWIPIYSAAALACYMAFKGLWPSWVFYSLAAAYLIGAVIQWPPEYEGILFGDLEMRSLNIELARESLGLSICALGMVLLGWLTGR